MTYHDGHHDTGWGILATGKIAHSFASDLAVVEGAHVAAVGSRTLGGAEAFTAQHGGTAYGSYAEMVADPGVDVVYVASPHSMHAEHVRLAFDAGKPVLCEKPLTLDAESSAALLSEARERGLFLMEAMWSACHPLLRRVVQMCRSGELGEVRQVVADLGFVVDAGPENRLLDPALGASALLDMGIYPLTLAHLLLGQPVEERAVANLSERGVDLDTAVLLRYDGGAVATLTTSMTSWTSRNAWIGTDLGRLDLHAPFHHPEQVTFTRYGSRAPGSEEDVAPEPEQITTDEPLVGRGYGNEALEVMRCLGEGLLESPLVPHAQTLALMRQLDRIRAHIGVDFG